MDTRFFAKLPEDLRLPYRDYYTYQNLQSVRTASFVLLTINLLLRIFYYIFPESLSKAQNFPEFSFTNWVIIIVAPFFYLISHLYILLLKKKQNATTGMGLVIFLFALFLIICGMYASFISTADPSNALTLYLLTLIIVSILLVFEYYETLVLIGGIELLFTMLLFHAQADATEMLYNQMISVILLSSFYITSRYFFSYKASYYQQIVEIRKKTAEIERANLFKNQVLGTVAHDLRNPIAAVESLAMMMELEDINEDTQDSLNMMKTSCVKARTIIDTLLEAARNENDTSFSTYKTELNGLLQGIIDTWKIQQRGKNKIVLISSIKAVYAQINHEKFPRAIDNLLSNALKFSNDTDKVEVYLSREKNKLIIQVKDSGVGIPQDMLPNLFDRFSGAGRTGLKGETSTGIGLSIVKEIVESHNGTISVQSQEGQGSTFTIILPQEGSVK